jgi:hypothetical protein
MCGAPIFFPSWNVLSQAVCPPPSNRAIDKLQRVFVHFQLQLLGSSSSLRKIYLDATISRRIATGTHSIHCLAPMIMCCTKFRLSTRLSRYRVDITRDRFQAHHAVSSYIEEQGGSGQVRGITTTLKERAESTTKTNKKSTTQRVLLPAPAPYATAPRRLLLWRLWWGRSRKDHRLCSPIPRLRLR